ncbi:MAG TPA: 5'-nucleotidase C-terminal domain-containing protein [Pyrinomonadaceae bacterium]|jgi:5'-nucleotidase|nr:5'-nucleotidase C-terminal domain-containing protein [Pyrinomonadaceae bacterium]
MNPHLMFARRTALALVLFITAIFSTAAQEKKQCNIKVTLLQVNDVYQFAPVDQGKSGGLARVLTLTKSIRKQNPNTLFLMAGDTISPSVESITYKGAQMIEAWNAIGLDYATFGNHEFDFGPDVLKERMNESKFSWIAANVLDTRTNQPFGDAKRFVIREFGGVKIGLFGLVLPETKTTSRPGNNVEFRNPCETAKEIVSELHGQGVKVVVALTHLSMREDKEVARCAGVNVIIGGHEHTLLESHAGGAPIFKMTSDARELGRIDLNISPTTGELDSIDWKVIPVDSTTREAPEFAAVYRKYAGLIAELAKPVGRTTVALDAGSAENRTRETNVGNFVTDAFRKATASDIGFMNGGSVRADTIIGPGRLTQRDLLSILPFKNKLVKIEVTGATLRAALEHGVSRSAEDAEPGGFPQVSGIQFSFDASRPSGSRLVDVKVNGLPLDNAKKYTLTTTTFIGLDGGDGYSVFRGSTVILPPEQAPIDVDAVRKALGTRAIAPKVEGRIKRLDVAQKSGANCPQP